MNPGQKQFFDFIIDRVNFENVEETKSFLEEGFKKQAAGAFTLTDIETTESYVMPRLREGVNKEEVQQAMNHFKQFYK